MAADSPSIKAPDIPQTASKVSLRANIAGRMTLKADGVSVPVIYMTGNEDTVIREAALASGCNRLPNKAVLGAGAAGRD